MEGGRKAATQHAGQRVRPVRRGAMPSGCSEGGRFRSELFGPGEYEQHSNQAHTIMMGTLMLSTFAWGVFFVGAAQCEPRTARMLPKAAAPALSGASSFGAGLYLAARVVWICEQCFSRGFVNTDLVQQQHLAIAALLLSMGSLDLLHAAALWLEEEDDAGACDGDDNWGAVGAASAHAQQACLPDLLRGFRGGWVHEIWFVDLSLIGAIFVTHPQGIGPRHELNSWLHVVIGVALPLGAHLLALDRRAGVANWRAVASGACFGAATVALAGFREIEENEGGHVGVAAACQPTGRAMAVVGMVASALSVAAIARALGRGVCQRAKPGRQRCCCPWRRRHGAGAVYEPLPLRDDHFDREEFLLEPMERVLILDPSRETAAPLVDDGSASLQHLDAPSDRETEPDSESYLQWRQLASSSSSSDEYM